MSGQHTPGPWQTARSGYGERLWTVYADMGSDIVTVALEASEANAHLVAAAPDLLFACQDALSFVRYALATGTDTPDGARRLEDLLRAAVARATGADR